jgi:hypothetical protein
MLGFPARTVGTPTNRGKARRYKSKGARFRKRPLQEREAGPSRRGGLEMTQQERSR